MPSQTNVRLLNPLVTDGLKVARCPRPCRAKVRYDERQTQSGPQADRGFHDKVF